MARPIVSEKKALILSFVLFLLGMAVLTYFRNFWPSIALVLGIPLALKQYLNGKKYDMYISLFVFIGVFITVQFNIKWHIFLPILFTMGGIYLFFKEFLNLRTTTEKDKEEEIEKEIDEEKK
jgi:predicted membrane protein